MLAHQGAWNVDFDTEPFGITHAFNFEIEPLKFDLVCERDILQRIRRQAGPIKIGQILDHHFGLFGLSRHDQARERIQRIEQEMWIDLIAQGTQLSILGGLRKARCFPFSFAHFTGITNGDI